jgi:hypothetical protein
MREYRYYRIGNVGQAGKIKDDLERSLGRYLTLSRALERARRSCMSLKDLSFLQVLG